jgi:SET domain-containing protein
MTNHQLPENLEFRDGIQGLGVFVKKTIKKGSVLFKMQGTVVAHPTRTSVQVGANKHIEDLIGSHVNHSCSPSAKVNPETQSFVSIKDLKEGDEITFDYNESEDILSSPFQCECCGKRILGRLVENELA